MMTGRSILFFLLIFLFLSVMVNAQEFVKDGLVAMWTLDKADISGEVVKDVFGKNNATLKGNPKSIAGVIGECLQFEGKAENYVEIPKMGSFEQVSVECWAMEDQFSGIQGIVSTWQWDAGKVHFKFESNQIQVHKNDGVKIVYPNPENGKWYHIVYTTDTKANKLQLYVNGKFITEGNSGATPEKWDERRIGSEHDGRWLIGKVDEVRIYKRVLTAKEVENNFNVKTNKLAVDPSGKSATCWGVLKQNHR